nr:MAG TPA: collagen alpha 1(VIII) chain protein [Caudoviricetes sp.]
MPKVLIGNVAGPKGPKGDKGDQGPEGPQGPQGEQGNINAGSTVSFTEALERENIKSGESCATIFGKIKKFFTDLKTVAFTGSYTDLSNKPEIVNNLAATSAGKVLDARQGKALDEAKLNKVDVVNNLVTTEEGKALDARQGKALNEKILGESSELGENYIKFENGFLLQWGTTAHDKVKLATSSVNLQVPYRDAGYRVSLTPGRNGNLIEKLWVGDSSGNNNQRTPNHFNVSSQAEQVSYDRAIEWATFGRWK